VQNAIALDRARLQRWFVEPEPDYSDPPVVAPPAGADDVEAPSEP